jgi:hypothetical protein
MKSEPVPLTTAAVHVYDAGPGACTAELHCVLLHALT